MYVLICRRIHVNDDQDHIISCILGKSSKIIFSDVCFKIIEIIAGLYDIIKNIKKYKMHKLTISIIFFGF